MYPQAEATEKIKKKCSLYQINCTFFTSVQLHVICLKNEGKFAFSTSCVIPSDRITICWLFVCKMYKYTRYSNAVDIIMLT